ncbi:MAG: sigma-70 family RNA polymerase sigma factor [Rhodobacterales bacterium]
MSENIQREKFEALLRVNVDALYRTALRMSRDPSVAEDLVQDASLRAYRTFSTGFEPDNFRAWIFRILINLHIDQSRLLTLVTVEHEVGDLPEVNHGPAQSFANARLGRDLSAAVDLLPDELKLVVQLVLVEGMSYREASESMECPDGTVRSRLNKARQLLRALLAEHAPESMTDGILRFPANKEKSG